MVDPSKFELYHFPLIDRTLFGLTVLVFEDGHFACEAIRLLSLRSGSRIRRADAYSQRGVTYRSTGPLW